MTTRQQPSWIEAAIADDAAAIATRASPSSTNLAHHVTSITASYDEPLTIGTLILRHGVTELARWNVLESFGMTFPSPILLPPGESAVLELSAGESISALHRRG